MRLPVKEHENIFYSQILNEISFTKLLSIPKNKLIDILLEKPYKLKVQRRKLKKKWLQCCVPKRILNRKKRRRS